MPLGDLSEYRDIFTRDEKTEAQVRLLARLPEPIERAVGQPRLLMWLAEAVPKPQHARRAFAPMRDDGLPSRALEVEMSEDAEPVRVALHRFDGVGVDGVAERAGRMDHRTVDPGRFHLGQRLVVRIRGVLAM